MSHREYRARLAWIEENLSDPERSDYYLMQIAQEIRRALSKHPNRIKLEDLKIKFRSKRDLVKDSMSKSKQAWMSVFSMLNRKK